MAVVGYHSLMEGDIFKDVPLTNFRKSSSSDSLRNSLLPKRGAISNSFTPGSYVGYYPLLLPRTLSRQALLSAAGRYIEFIHPGIYVG